MTLNVTTALQTEIAKWNDASRFKSKLRRKARLCTRQKIKTVLLRVKLEDTAFVFDNMSILNICIAAAIIRLPLRELGELLRKLRFCYISEADALSLLTNVMAGICAEAAVLSTAVRNLAEPGLFFYLEHLVDFGVDKQKLCDHVYQYIFCYITKTSDNDRIMSLMNSLREKGFNMSITIVYVVLSLVPLLDPITISALLRHLEIGNPDHSDMPRKHKARIFDDCFCYPSCPDIISTICRLNLLPDSIHVINVLIWQIQHSRFVDQFGIIKTIRIICLHRPGIIPIIEQLLVIAERYTRFLAEDICYFIPPEYILAGIDDAYYVQYGDIKLYGIQQNLISKWFDRMYPMGPIGVVYRNHNLRKYILERFQWYFSQGILVDLLNEE